MIPPSRTGEGFTRYRELEEPVPPEGRQEFDPMERRRRWLREDDPEPGGRFVLYWMRMAKRARDNLALDEAIRRANALDLPVVVYEGLSHRYPGASRRTHRFVLEAARDTARGLRSRGIRYLFHLRRGPDDPDDALLRTAREAALVVVDEVPTYIWPRLDRVLLEGTAGTRTPVLAVDDGCVVPMAELEGREYAARTIRPKLHRLLPAYLHPVRAARPRIDGEGLPLPAEGIQDLLRSEERPERTLQELLDACHVDQEIRGSPRFRGGRRAGLGKLGAFVAHRLARYADESRDPGSGVESDLSPYLHFGCLSAREVALAVLNARGIPGPSVDAFLEQLVVRRELAYNFCRYTVPEEHTELSALPEWARHTLADHADDPRPRLYARSALEAAETHDEVWNAAQRELLHTGTIHGYVRMLWGKQLIRWTPDHESALRLMVDLHHRYALDGRNPNTYANVLWCFGLHDRAFGESEVLGKTRPMTSRNTRRKFDLEPYFRRVDRWAERGSGGP
jgi:deoxyribodipyrimidine photo-lyase